METKESWKKLRVRAKRKQQFYLLRTWLHLLAVFLGFILDLEIFQFTGKSQIILFLVFYLLYVLSIHFLRNLRYFLPRKNVLNWNRVRGISTLISILFLGFWVGYVHFQPAIEEINQYHTFYHAGLLMALISIGMNYRKAAQWWQLVDITPGRMIFILYGVVSFVSTFFLILPVSLKQGASLELIDAFFISVSALAVTGLTPVNIAETFSFSGMSIILFLIQLGGLGIVIISVGITALTRNRLSLSQSLMGRELYDLPSVGAIGPFLRRVLLFTLISEGVGFVLILSVLPSHIDDRFFHALFHTISAFCNAGFSSFSQNLNIPGLQAVKTVVCILILLGGIGFPVIFEVLRKFSRKKAYRSLSSNTVLTLYMSGGLLILGCVSIFLIELFESQSNYDGIGSLLMGSFYSISARTAGFNISSLGDLTYGSQLVITFLMVIGGSPLSTAGGIKTTTAGIILVAASSLLRGHKWLQFGTSEINAVVLQKAVTLLVLYFATLFFSVILLVAIEPLPPWDITFEVISALSTVGLSLGVTEKLSPLSKIIVIGLMLTGRLGFFTIVYVGIGRIDSQRFHYARERFYVG